MFQGLTVNPWATLQGAKHVSVFRLGCSKLGGPKCTCEAAVPLMAFADLGPDRASLQSLWAAVGSELHAIGSEEDAAAVPVSQRACI